MNINQNSYVKAVLINSIEADAEQFLQYWVHMMAERPDEFPADLDEAEWIDQFWAWMGGE